MRIEQKIKVEFNYNIYFTHDVFNPQNTTLKKLMKEKRAKIMVFIDSNVHSCWPDIKDRIHQWFDTYPDAGTIVKPIAIVKGGEECKTNFKYFKIISQFIKDSKLDRNSFIIIIGGGAVLDAVGFVASITYRGIPHIRIPTTVLSQCDSGIGVKNAINFYNEKNYFGTFMPPYGVINDFNFLKTLKTRYWIAGISEAFKVAIIKDNSFLNFLISNTEKLKKREQRTMGKIIYYSAKLHAEHISKGNDPFEKTSKPLDFGHWAAHYIESKSKYRINHGEAVAVGIILDMTIAKNRGLINKNEYEMVYNALKNFGFKLWYDSLLNKGKNKFLEIYDGLEEFRRHLGGKLTLIMPDGLGNRCEISDISHREIVSALLEMKKNYETQ